MRLSGDFTIHLQLCLNFFFFNDTATTEIYTLSLHDALPIFTCTIDGAEVIARPGTNMIEAAKHVGVEIPYYCYHPRLTIAANCRMCLVEVSNSPKLGPACQTPLSDGLAIKTTTLVVKESHRSVME